MSGLPWVLGAVVVAVLAFVLDRLLLAAEARGWIYWRRRKASASTAGNAMVSMQALFEPDKEHVVEEARRADIDVDLAADDEPGNDR